MPAMTPLLLALAVIALLIIGVVLVMNFDPQDEDPDFQLMTKQELDELDLEP